jgi:hypothetical protein
MLKTQPENYISSKQNHYMDKKWRTELKESKSVYTEFADKIIQQPNFVNDAQVPYTNTVKHLDITFDVKLRWRESILRKKT